MNPFDCSLTNVLVVIFRACNFHYTQNFQDYYCGYIILVLFDRTIGGTVVSCQHGGPPIREKAPLNFFNKFPEATTLFSPNFDSSFR